MKKVDDEKLLEMLAQGIPQKQIAAFFGCSPSYIVKKKKRLHAMEMPESFKKLSVKDQAFVLNRLQNKSVTQSALEAYDCTSRESAKTIGYRKDKEPDIQESYDDLLAQVGAPRRRRMERHRDLIESHDYAAVAKGLEMTNKLTGSYIDRVEVSGQFSTVHADVAAIKELMTLQSDYAEFQRWKKGRDANKTEAQEVQSVIVDALQIEDTGLTPSKNAEV